jgi:hypothetical protein
MPPELRFELDTGSTERLRACIEVAGQRDGHAVIFLAPGHDRGVSSQTGPRVEIHPSYRKPVDASAADVTEVAMNGLTCLSPGPIERIAACLEADE